MTGRGRTDGAPFGKRSADPPARGFPVRESGLVPPERAAVRAERNAGESHAAMTSNPGGENRGPRKRGALDSPLFSDALSSLRAGLAPPGMGPSMTDAPAPRLPTTPDSRSERFPTSGASGSRSLAKMTWPEVESAVEEGTTTIILPLGATEQHGPHLPLATDTIRADALAELLAERLPESLVAPTLPFGCSDEHSGFAGLLGLEAETLASVILDVARRASGWGASRLVILSAHGGNGRALPLAVERIERELPNLAVWSPKELASIAKSVLGVAAEEGVSANDLGIHAGESETSEMLHLRPDLVDASRLSPGFTGDMEAVVEELYAGGLKPVTENGVLGDPTRADSARGSRYLEALADEVAARVRSGTNGR